MKTCKTCNETKPLTEYYKQRSNKDGLYVHCKSCVSLSRKKHYLEVKDSVRSNQREYYQQNKDYFSKKSKKYREENRDKVLDYNKLYSKKHYKENKHKYIEKSRVRRGVKQDATPNWLSGPQIAHIKRIYKLRDMMSDATGVEYHVDHIVPLRGKDICGLHVPWNLEVIPATDNLAKGNRY